MTEDTTTASIVTTTTTTVTTVTPVEVAHAQAEPVVAMEVEFFPPHPPRAQTAEYNATHRLLVDTLDTPCRICGVRKSTLGDPLQNPVGARDLETHHYPIQREYADAVDYRKVMRDFTQVVDQKSLLLFIDSPANMWVICDHHHRHPTDGIHHAVVNDWVIHRYLFDGYILNDTAANEATDLAKDEAIVDAAVPVDLRI